MAVPKKKTSKSNSRVRRSAYYAKQRVKIGNKLCLVKCTNCWEIKKNHQVCPECGYYKWEQCINKEDNSSVKVIKA